MLIPNAVFGLEIIVGCLMLPKILPLFVKDYHKKMGIFAKIMTKFGLNLSDFEKKHEEKHAEISKITQKNADDLMAKINLVRHAPKIIYNRINNIHHKSFPQAIAQIGAVGRDIAGRQRQQGRQSSPRRQKPASSSGSSDDGGGGDGEPPRTRLLLDQLALAESLCLSKKSVQNIYSSTPWLLPSAIKIPGARGPRWTIESVQAWLDGCPRHTPKATPAPSIKKRKVGRPRLAHALGLVAGGAK